MSGKFPSDLRAFIERCLTSAIQVEVLLLLHGERDRTWTATDVSRQLQVEADQAETAMAHLARNGLVAHERAGYRLAPARRRDADLVDTLVELYPTYRVAIISIIFSQPTGPIRDFSEAFRLRDEE